MRRLGIAAGVLVAVAALVVAGLLTGIVPTGRAGEIAGTRPSATSTGATGGPSAVASGTPTGVPSPALPSGGPDTPAPVLAPVSGDAGLDGSELADRIRSVSTKGLKGKVGIAVADLASGKVAWSQNGRTGFAPASTTKLLTTTAALDLLGPDHRFTTSVTLSGKRVVLVGGGDPYLAAKTDSSSYPARPSLQQLAASTATALKARKLTTVSLGYDDSLFSGPSWNPKWPATYSDQVSPISALWADEGRVTGYSPGPRVSDPPLEAAKDFAGYLEKQGIEVTGTPSSADAPGSAAAPTGVIASIRSLPLSMIVERLLTFSDNDAAEVVFRQAALAAGQPGSFTGGQKAVHATLVKLGVWVPGTVIWDGSGLTRQTRVAPDTMVKVIGIAAGEGTLADPALRPVLTGMPVAGAAGSLLQSHGRYVASGTGAALGLVRAKTGTLTGVHALAGYVRTRSGATAVFDLVINDTTTDYAAEVYLQRVTAAITGCGC